MAEKLFENRMDTMIYQFSPHHQDSYQDEAAMPTYDMPSLFPVEMQFFPPQESTRQSYCKINFSLQVQI